LAIRIQNGDVEARNQLVTANLRFALNVARHYQGSGMGLDDLISAANVGLMEAARRFDGATGVRFITYAVWWIRQSILKTLNRDRHLVRVPGHVTDLMSKIYKISVTLQQDFERQPLVEEIAEEVHAPVRSVRRALTSTQDVRSLDEEVGDPQEHGMSLGDVLGDPVGEDAADPLERKRAEDQVRGLIDSLDPREAKVICRYFGLDGMVEESLAKIGREMHLSRERIRQIKCAALDHMRARVVVHNGN